MSTISSCYGYIPDKHTFGMKLSEVSFYSNSNIESGTIKKNQLQCTWKSLTNVGMILWENVCLYKKKSYMFPAGF